MTWTPTAVVIVALAISGSLTSMIVTIIAALKGSAAQAQALAAQAQAAANKQSLQALSDRVSSHDQQINQLALQAPPPTVAPADK